ncbi:uncharacterized protein LOC116619189 isoform X2 [Nematostella vectensis]|uniref:uncharacterized protein LOC116619189 isoform X2 n=1 Tax=Nematostella vectensis TaxID=45351 RepID=UPI0020774540|nr:uncharacterized protein LOC116619189 isoform X2 [Nematostella vectensis]
MTEKERDELKSKMNTGLKEELMEVNNLLLKTENERDELKRRVNKLVLGIKGCWERNDELQRKEIEKQRQHERELQALNGKVEKLKGLLVKALLEQEPKVQSRSGSGTTCVPYQSLENASGCLQDVGSQQSDISVMNICDSTVKEQAKQAFGNCISLGDIKEEAEMFDLQSIVEQASMETQQPSSDMYLAGHTKAHEIQLQCIKLGAYPE